MAAHKSGIGRFFSSSLLFVFCICLLLTQAFAVASEIEFIYIVPQVHLDIGFTAPRDTVALEYKYGIDNALKLLDMYDDFKFTIESYWQLEQWLLRTRNQESIDKLIGYIKAGRIAVSGSYATMHNALMGYEDINRLVYPAADFARKYGIEIDTVWQNDVPGYSSAYPQALAKSGIKYLATGLNLWLGGGLYLPKADTIFRWVGPDGSSVLTWIGYRHYMEAMNEWGIFYMSRNSS